MCLKFPSFPVNYLIQQVNSYTMPFRISLLEHDKCRNFFVCLSFLLGKRRLIIGKLMGKSDDYFAGNSIVGDPKLNV